MNAARFAWYWHRLRAMSPSEVAAHARKKWFQWADARGERNWAAAKLAGAEAYPQLPDPAAAPEVLRQALQRDAADILAGRWKAFGHLELKVDDPPQWHTDYLVGKNLATTQSAFKLNHRELPGGADIKLIWELSRWYQLTRLAMAAYVLDDERAARTCLRWLEDWVARNPPYRGWNWTSALESGMRLVQFTWIDALLGARAEAWGCAAELEQLRQAILPPHIWYTWRYRSFGSSANNHLIGELAGLIVATVRWPALAKWGAPLEVLQPLWEREVLAQFAEDGGNREQALNYHLFSWEFCWHAQTALRACGREVPAGVRQRLNHAADFYALVQAKSEVWDYGDSDSAFVVPVFRSDATAAVEWRAWMIEAQRSPDISFWLKEAPVAEPNRDCVRFVGRAPFVKFPQSGYLIHRSWRWFLRWDLSPLGYPATAAHGHLDALHLSIRLKGVALVIDPGTGAYYPDPRLRAWLASRAAHNGPCPVGPEFPRRIGAFLWVEQHETPAVWVVDHPRAELSFPEVQTSRQVVLSEDGLSWTVEDACADKAGEGVAFTVRWQFAPGCWVKQLDDRKFAVRRGEVSLVVEVDWAWAEVELAEPLAESEPRHFTPGAAGKENFDGLVSPAFRRLAWAPCLKLTAPGGAKPGVFRTTFSAPAP